jgi:hypothetical protein
MRMLLKNGLLCFYIAYCDVFFDVSEERNGTQFGLPMLKHLGEEVCRLCSLIREANETDLYSNNTNGEDRLLIRRSWQPLIIP